MATILMMLSKMATLSLLKPSYFWNKGYDFIIPIHDVIDKILSYDSNYIVDVVMWSRKALFLRSGLASSSIIWDWRRVKSSAKGLTLYIKMFWEIIPMFVEVTGKKLIGETFFPYPQSYIGLKSRCHSKTRLAVSQKLSDFIC